MINETLGGKWVSGAGTLIDPHPLNLYVYCNNDPINNVDPSGFDSVSDYLEERFRILDEIDLRNRQLMMKLDPANPFQGYREWSIRYNQLRKDLTQLDEKTIYDILYSARFKKIDRENDLRADWDRRREIIFTDEQVRLIHILGNRFERLERRLLDSAIESRKATTLPLDIDERADYKVFLPLEDFLSRLGLTPTGDYPHRPNTAAAGPPLNLTPFPNTPMGFVGAMHANALCPGIVADPLKGLRGPAMLAEGALRTPPWRIYIGAATAVEKTAVGAVYAVTHPQQVVQAIHRLATDPETRQKLIDAIQKKLSDDSYENIGELIVEIPLLVTGVGAAVKGVATAGKIVIILSKNATAVTKVLAKRAAKVGRNFLSELKLFLIDESGSFDIFGVLRAQNDRIFLNAKEGLIAIPEGYEIIERGVTVYMRPKPGGKTKGPIYELRIEGDTVSVVKPGAPKGAPNELPAVALKGSKADFEYWVTPQTKGIIANLDRNGFVEFKINTEGSGVQGTDLFVRMMQHFGDYAKGVWGKWVSGTNLTEVNRLTALGVPLEQAITRTWTANRARDAGFGKATLIKADGKAGEYTNVEVLFTK